MNNKIRVNKAVIITTLSLYYSCFNMAIINNDYKILSKWLNENRLDHTQRIELISHCMENLNSTEVFNLLALGILNKNFTREEILYLINYIVCNTVIETSLPIELTNIISSYYTKTTLTKNENRIIDFIRNSY